MDLIGKGLRTMRVKRKDNVLKQIVAGLLVVVMMISTFAFMQTEAQATSETVDIVDGILYSKDYYSIKEYYVAKKAPVKENYVFGGWYQRVNDTYKPLNETKATAIANGTDTSTVAYAKFVPAYVLSVKAQNASGTSESMTKNTSVRIITATDSKNYKKVGFEIWLGNVKPMYQDEEKTPLETNRVYDGIKIGTSTTKTAAQIFGEPANHVAVWELTDIMRDNHDKIIYVRPYWITMDGTTVQGLAKYVHIEDDYKNYVSVPINLLNKEQIKQVAAGMVRVTYTNAESAEVGLVYKGVEPGRLLPEIMETQSGSSIKLVANALTEGEYNSDETIYANIRFQKDTTKTDVDVNFDMILGDFCDWKEEDVNVSDVWDIKYEATTTHN